MQNLLTIEESFLQKSQVKQGLHLQELTTINRGLANAQKKKFEHTLALSKVALKSFEWFTSTEAQALCAEEGIVWNREAFAGKVFGVQNSYFGKLLKAGGLQAEVVDVFIAKCDEAERQKKNHDRTLAGLLKFAKAGIESEVVEPETEETDGDVEQGTETEATPQTIFTLSFKGLNGNVAVRINEAGVIETTNTTEEIAQAIAFLTNSINQ
jgi:hypothetical protein